MGLTKSKLKRSDKIQQVQQLQKKDLSVTFNDEINIVLIQQWWKKIILNRNRNKELQSAIIIQRHFRKYYLAKKINSAIIIQQWWKKNKQVQQMTFFDIICYMAITLYYGLKSSLKLMFDDFFI